METLIPGLPDELSLISFTYLPVRMHAKASCVSHTWQGVFKSQALHDLRLKCGSLETWVLFCFSRPSTNNSISCWVVDSIGIHSHPLDMGCASIHCMKPVGTTARGEVLLASFMIDQPGCPSKSCRYNVLHRRWLHPFAPQMLTNHVGSACATLDGYVYAAGGFTDTAMKTAGRLDCTNMCSWERLPDMHMARQKAAAVALHDCLYVIGGYGEDNDVEYSGEIWDPRCQEWTLVPELWPSHIFDSYPSTGNVTTLKGRLFAIRLYQVMMYNHATKQWACLGDILLHLLHRPREYLEYDFELLGVGGELWLVALPLDFFLAEEDRKDIDFRMLACIPCSGESLTWRQLPYSFDRTLEFRFVFPIVV